MYISWPIRYRLLSLIFLAVLFTPNISLAKTITQWRSEINPGKLTLTCERSFNLSFSRKVNDIAVDKGIPVAVENKKGLVGNLNEVVELMQNLRKAGFTISGDKGKERASIKTRVRITYQRIVTILINKNIDRAGFNLEVKSKGGRGRIDKKNVTEYARADMQQKIKASYNAFKTDMVNQGKIMRRSLNNKRYNFTNLEIKKIKRDKGGAVVRELTTPLFCDRQFKVTIKAIWEKYKK